jgi:hypothetical protein
MTGPPKPFKTVEELRASGSKTRDGKLVDLDGLEGADGTHYAADDKVNRQLSHIIHEAVSALKSDEHGPKFVIGWRLYPNANHPLWKSEHEQHICGCGCGCGCGRPVDVAPPTPLSSARRRSAKSAAEKATKPRTRQR